MRHFFLFIIMFVLSFPALAEKVVVTQSKQGFSASLLVVKQEDFFKQWQAQGMKSTEVRVASVKSVAQTQPFWIAVLTGGAGVVGENCDVSYDISVKYPNGKTFKSFPNLVACKGKVQEPGRIYLADEIVKLLVTATDPLGNYSITLTVRDKVKAVELTLFRVLEVTEYRTDGLMLPLLNR